MGTNKKALNIIGHNPDGKVAAWMRKNKHLVPIRNWGGKSVTYV